MKIALENYEKPLNAISCEKGYWVTITFGEFIKHDNGTLRVFSKEEILEARELYKKVFSREYNMQLEKEENKKLGKVQPMFTAKFDNEKDMKILKSVFSVSALEKADFNMDKIQENLNKEIATKNA